MAANEYIKLQAAEILKRSVARPFVPDDFPQWEQVAESAWGLPQINRPWDFTALTKDSVTSVGMFDGTTMLGGSLNVAKIGEDYNPYLLIHMLGVHVDYQGIGVGKRLMEANYALIQNNQLGPIETIKLTSDPFDTRNAHLYLHNCRMHSGIYLDDAYKGLADNGGVRHRSLPSDRLYYESKPNTPWVKNGVLPGPEKIIELAQRSPQVLDGRSSTSIVLVETPQDYVALKERYIEQAIEWQTKQAKELTLLFLQGYTAVDHTVVNMNGDKHHYVICMKGFNENDTHCLMQEINSLL